MDARPVILVVEDDADILSFIALELMTDYQVVKAVNGRDGLVKARECVPDLVITDVMMPVMDGISLCNELKTNPETSHVPVIMLTAKISDESQLEGLRSGADDYVTKPFNILLLQARISNLLESRRTLREKFCRDYPVLTSDLPAGTPDKSFMEKAMRVVEENYSNGEFKSDEFASCLNMGLRTLHRKLKAVSDRTPADFINEFRMGKAADLLKNSAYPITEIAFHVGCDDSSNFSRIFKKYYDMTPTEYRAAHRSF